MKLTALQVDALIRELDSIARDYDMHEYGLPVNDDEQMALMKDAVWKYFS